MQAERVVNQDSAIYFSVDYDASANEIAGVITQYFEGVAQGFSNKGATYAIGVYGSGAVCLSLKNAGKVSYTWLAQSPGWSGSTTYTEWNMKQHLPTTTICNIQGCNKDTLSDSFGGFTIPE